MFDQFVEFVRSYYNKPEGFISLHEPRFVGNDKKYVLDAIDSTFVSSVGKYVDQFEAQISEYTGAKYAVATVNGSAALHISLLLAGVKRGDLVITQPLSFIATCNCITYLGAEPIFIDVSPITMGLSAEKLRKFLAENTKIINDECYHITTGKRIGACVPMHTFGHPVELNEIVKLCENHKIKLIEDAAESIGSKYNGAHTGTFGLAGVFSFNGNKTITCGGGGMIITNDEHFAKRAKHLTTQAKVPHRWNFNHDHIGYNYRLPNLNAALGCAQLEQLDIFIQQKRKLAIAYESFFAERSIQYMKEPSGTFSNYWLNAILLNDVNERDAFLTYTNDRGVMTRPSWTLMNKLDMFRNCICEDISNAINFENCLVNLPSSANN